MSGYFTSRLGGLSRYVVSLLAGSLTASAMSLCSCHRQPSPDAVPVYTCKVVRSYRHDRSAWTQGLVFDGGFLYESTGRYGQSSLRKVGAESGNVVMMRKLGDQYFGEGMTIFDDKIIVLTWREKTGFVYDKETFRETGRFTYPTEGWGLTHDGTRLIMSDGTNELYFLDPATFERTGQIEVTAAGQKVDRLNELEYINGSIYANIWEQDRVAIISPQTGQVEAWIDLSGLRQWERPGSRPGGRPRRDVLNGIAYDRDDDRLFVTGKLWPEIFEIEVIEQSQ